MWETPKPSKSLITSANCFGVIGSGYNRSMPKASGARESEEQWRRLGGDPVVFEHHPQRPLTGHRIRDVNGFLPMVAC
jgi:hypothetical protein